MNAVIELPRVSDGEREKLLRRLDMAILNARQLGLNAEQDALHYRAEIGGGDPLAYVLLRHFAAGICAWIEARASLATDRQTVERRL